MIQDSSCGDFVLIAAEVSMGAFWEDLEKLEKLVMGDDGILEEASCSSYFSPVRKLGRADLNHDICDLCR
jgi:hypothetical protein